ncbi:alpha/beta fold hydrolase [uncultured Devosia sp.]|uniref:alpha/beta fold hydrolase n=1 Tax=uncultured Devosia sp. TaxID=211434 RepID=UPI0035C9C31F
MPTEVIMPKVDMDMTHGTFATWHVAEGAEVRQGDPLFDIETEKAAMEVEAPVSGRLRHIAAQPGDRIAVGAAIAWLYAQGETETPPPAAATSPPPPVQAAAPVATQAAAAPPAALDLSSPLATPAARAAARRAGLELADIAGTGPQGRIQRDDIDTLARAPAPTPAAPAIWHPQPGALNLTRRPGTGMPLLLLHGFAADSKSWAPLENALAVDRPLIRIDLPGHGRSPQRSIDSFAALARMLVEAFDAALPDRGATHILAHSLGGALALAIADIRPRQV